MAARIACFWTSSKPGRPGVRDVGQQLEALVAEARDPRGGFVERDSCR